MGTKKWYLDGKNTIQDKTMREQLKSLGVEDFVNSTKGWGSVKKPPRKFVRESKREKVTWGDKEFDYTNFKDKYIPIDSNKIYYIQIGGYGTYYMGRDPAKMSRFVDMAKFNGSLKLRIRKKGSSSSPNYRFSTALLIDKKPTKSAFDISKDDAMDFLIANMV